MTWEIILFLAAAVNGIVISVILLTSYTNFKKTCLGIYLLLFSIVIIHYVNFWTKTISPPLFVQWIFALSDWLMAPALYFFFRGKEPWQKK